jgi:hypothetical protein
MGQQLSLSSALSSMLAPVGGRSLGESSSRKPGPNWATGIRSPSRIRVILTSAEWPPLLLNWELMADIVVENSAAYAARYGLRLAEQYCL